MAKTKKAPDEPTIGAVPRPLSGVLFKPISAGMNSFSLNACVGHNTGSRDNSESYSDGFQIGTEVLLKAAGVSAPDGAGEKWGEYPPVDALVYPICYGARHHAELVLKRIAQQSWELYKLRRPNNPQKFDQPKTVDLSHNIYDVWEQAHSYCEASDARLAALSAGLEPYIRDIDHVDDTGQAFRYPVSAQTSNLHLTGLSVINLAHFAAGFAKMTDLLVRLESMIFNVRQEVATGTYTSKLNREQLVAIAKRLPHADSSKDEHLKVKAEVMADYGISGSQFDQARNVIVKTHSLAHHVGITLPLKGVTKHLFQRLKHVHAKQLQAAGAITDEESAALYALRDIGLGNLYPEMFEKAVVQLSSDASGNNHNATATDAEHHARKVRGRPDIIELALKKMGQAQLAAEFADVYGKEIEAWQDAMGRDDGRTTAEILEQARSGVAPAVEEKGAE